MKKVIVKCFVCEEIAVVEVDEKEMAYYVHLCQRCAEDIDAEEQWQKQHNLNDETDIDNYMLDEISEKD